MEPPHLYDLLGPYQHVCMDYCGPFPITTKEGKESKAWVAVMVDYFTKIAEFVVVYDKSAPTAARAIYDHWLTRYPKPAKWTTDHGTEFGDVVTHMLKKFGILHVRCAVQNPKAGQWRCRTSGAEPEAPTSSVGQPAYPALGAVAAACPRRLHAQSACFHRRCAHAFLVCMSTRAAASTR